MRTVDLCIRADRFSTSFRFRLGATPLDGLRYLSLSVDFRHYRKRAYGICKSLPRFIGGETLIFLI